MLKPNHFRSKLFRGYLLTIIGVIVVTLSVMGILTTRRIAQNMKEEGIRITENRLFTAAEDLENQLETIREMVVEVSSLQSLRLDNLQKNKYNELEALLTLKKYGNVSDIAESFFVKNRTNANVYTSAGTTMPVDVYFTDKLKIKATDDVKEIMDAICDDPESGGTVWTENDLILFIYPMEKYSTGWNKPDGVVCVQSSVPKLKKRMEQVAGDLNGNISVYYQDICLLSENSEINFDDMLEMTSRTEKMKVCLRIDTNHFFNWKNVFAKEDLMLFSIVFLVLLFVAYIVSSSIYSPIKSITDKINSAANDSMLPSWDNINRMIDDLLMSNEKDQKLLQEQYRLLREQTIQSVVSGGSLDKLQKYLTLLNINLEAAFFGLIVCEFADEQNEEYAKTIWKNIEDLSEKDLRFFPYWESKKALNILVSAEEEYQFDESIDLLQALFESMERNVCIQMRARSTQLEELCHAKSTTETIRKDLPIPSEDNGKNAKKNQTANQIMEYIQTHCTDYDMSLDLVSQKFGITPSYMCKIMKQEVGMSYKEYLTGLRINKAKTILREENIGLKDVCERVGYTNVSHFIKVFTNYTGVTPAKYRDMSEKEE